MLSFPPRLIQAQHGNINPKKSRGRKNKGEGEGKGRTPEIEAGIAEGRGGREAKGVEGEGGAGGGGDGKGDEGGAGKRTKAISGGVRSRRVGAEGLMEAGFAGGDEAREGEAPHRAQRKLISTYETNGAINLLAQV